MKFKTSNNLNVAERIPSLPPKGNNTNTEINSGFVLFFSNEYFGINVNLDHKKNKLPGV